MTQWNLIYNRRKGFNRQVNGIVESILHGSPFLPVEPPVFSALIRAKIPGTAYCSEIRDFIAVSPALMFNFLNTVHSPFTSEHGRVSGINDVIRIIGDDLVSGLLKEYMDQSRMINASSGIHPCTDENFYIATRAASLAVLIADETGYASPFSAYVAALLHNLGAVALAARFPIFYSRMAASGNTCFSDHVESEESELGINHCFLGARMVERWRSFPFLADAIFYHHHSPEKIRQANRLVQIVYLSTMISSRSREEHLRYLEAGRELFGFSQEQADEFLSIADLKTQGRLMKLGITPILNKGEPLYQPDTAADLAPSGEAPAHSLATVLSERIRKTEDKNVRFRLLGQALHAVTGLDEILYFKHNAEENSIYGISLKEPDNANLSNDLVISLKEREGIIVGSYLMGAEINSLDRMENAAPHLFDLQVSNYMNREGLYAVPIISRGKASGVLVAGVNSSGAVRQKAGQKIRALVEPILSYIFEEEGQVLTGAAGENAGTDPIQMRKLIHEINNPLSAIKNFLKVLNMKLDDINVETSEIKIIDDELNRISKLLKEFRSSSPESIKEISASDIKNIISDTVLLIKNSMVNGLEVNITVRSGENIPDVMIDRDAFRQVLINLFNNAIEAMPGGGNISIDAQLLPGGRGADPGPSDREADRDRIEITISDDGPGIPEHLREGIFKKQSTTKADHDGLGLMIVHELVKRIGGTITFDNNSNRGACFKITIPVN